MPNNLISCDILCPFYLSEQKLSISCEDSPHFFTKKSKKNWWIKSYCVDNWQGCKYAAGLLKAYDDDERGDEAALENKKNESLREELRLLSGRYGQAKSAMERKDRKIEELRKENEDLSKVNENNVLHRKRLYKRLRETKQELEQATKEMYDQLMQINDIYMDRLAYLIDTKCDDGLLQSDVDKWAAEQTEKYSIHGAWDEETYERKWLVVRMPKENEDEKLLGEETKK